MTRPAGAQPPAQQFNRAPRANEAYGGLIQKQDTGPESRMRAVMDDGTEQLRMDDPFGQYYRINRKGRKNTEPSGLIHTDIRGQLGPLVA